MNLLQKLLSPVASPGGRLHSCRAHNPAQTKQGSSVDSGEPFFLAPSIAGFERFVICSIVIVAGRTPPQIATKKAQTGSKSRDTPPSRPATEVSQEQGRNELTQIAVLHHNTNRHRRENPRPSKCEFITPRSQVRKLFPQLHPRQRNDARRPIESENEYRLLATLLVFMDRIVALATTGFFIIWFFRGGSIDLQVSNRIK